jgi:hypothetical protein
MALLLLTLRAVARAWPCPAWGVLVSPSDEIRIGEKLRFYRQGRILVARQT